MSTHTDPDVLTTAVAYSDAVSEVRRNLKRMDEALTNRLVAFDDDGHFQYVSDASGIASRILRHFCDLSLVRLMEAAADADKAIIVARERAKP